MRNLILIAAVAALSLAGLQSCLVAPKVAPIALFNPAQVSWPAVEIDFDRGVSEGLSDATITAPEADALDARADAMTAALHASDPAAVRMLSWGTMEPWAERGIGAKLEAEEIGPGVAESLREQISNFTETIDKIEGLNQ